MYILAHDLGTSGNKATLFDESGLLIASLILPTMLPATGRNRIRTIGGKPSLTQHRHFSNWYHPMILPE